MAPVLLVRVSLTIVSFAYSRFSSGPGLDAPPDGRSLYEICIAAMKRFSPCTLRSRRKGPEDQWTIPEAAFQDELYRCVFVELCGCPILSEYSHDRKGCIDFLIPDKGWGIELLQNGSNEQILEHSSRFERSGKYQKWGIIQEYIVLNFCHRTTHRDLRSTSKTRGCDPIILYYN